MSGSGASLDCFHPAAGGYAPDPHPLPFDVSAHYICNGWYGGLMTTIAAATVAQIGDMNYGLWCPFVIAADTFVFGLWFVRKTMRMGNDAED